MKNLISKNEKYRSVGLVLTLAVAFLGYGAFAQSKFESFATSTSVIELYTSEGCSSCPPADRQFSQLREAGGLWKFFVPLAFHVDYWNNLGWPDPMSSSANSNRQRSYGGAVATPAIKINGIESNRLSSAIQSSESGLDKVGIVELRRLGEKKFQISFKPIAKSGTWEGSVALLGFGIVSKVTAGENAGHTFTHDFVVLGVAKKTLDHEGTGSYTATIEPQTLPITPQEFGVAAWINSTGNLKPIQATGGMLKDLSIVYEH